MKTSMITSVIDRDRSILGNLGGHSSAFTVKDQNFVEDCSACNKKSGEVNSSPGVDDCVDGIDAKPDILPHSGANHAVVKQYNAQFGEG